MSVTQGNLSAQQRQQQQYCDGIEVYTYSTLEVASEPPAASTVNPEYPVDQNGRYLYAGQSPRGVRPSSDQAGKRGRIRDAKWMWTSMITSAVISALVVGGIVGGGLGASLAECKANTSEFAVPDSTTTMVLDDRLSSTSATTRGASTSTSATPSANLAAETATTTGGLLLNYRAAPSSAVGLLAIECEALARDDQVTAENEKFAVRCRTDLFPGPKTDASGAVVYLADLVGLVAYTLDDCLEACSLYSKHSVYTQRGDGCGAVTFCAAMQRHTRSTGGNCWLKNDTLPVAYAGEDNSEDFLGAFRVW